MSADPTSTNEVICPALRAAGDFAACNSVCRHPSRDRQLKCSASHIGAFRRQDVYHNIEVPAPNQWWPIEVPALNLSGLPTGAKNPRRADLTTKANLLEGHIMADIKATPNHVLNSIAARLLQRAEANCEFHPSGTSR